MKILSVVTMAVMVAGANSYAGGTARAAERKVMVCIESRSDFVVPRAKMIAAGMFVEAGVKLEWNRDRTCSPDAIRITFSDRTDQDFLPGALAYALLFEGTQIKVFYDRLQQQFETKRLPGVLAHVLVHEIAHILQGVYRHSASGIMQSAWQRADYDEMTARPLPFTPMDVELIHSGRDVRESRRAATTVTASTVVAQ